MGYQALDQQDGGNQSDSHSTPSPNPQQQLASHLLTPPLSASLFWDHHNTSKNSSTSQDKNIYADLNTNSQNSGFDHIIKSIVPNTRTIKIPRYDMVENDDFAAGARSSTSPASETSVPIHRPRPRPQRRTSPATAAESTISKRSDPPEPVIRTASGRSVALRHPTPDLQILQGAYIGNIQHLEKTAERLSMTSSIDDAIKELHDEQKRSDSRRSSLLSSHGVPGISRQVSASSIVEVNSTARSGGYSPAGFMMSPKGSFSTAGGRGRSASKSSRYGSRPEPELEGRPLESFVNMSLPSIPPSSPILSRSASIAEQDENSATMTLPAAEISEDAKEIQQKGGEDEGRPSTSASVNTFEQEKMFADFDGIHADPQRKVSEEGQRMASGNGSIYSDNSQRRISSGETLQMRAPSGDDSQRRLSSGNRLSMARPQSYADPTTGQQMVYYPAPVPMMLNLPQKLSKQPSAQARNKRRSQVLSGIPAAARQSAIWLPDVLENEEDQNTPGEDPTQQQEYIPQHQRASMGGRRLTQDLSHLPAQLRASTYFDIPSTNQVVELKEQSAVATLDSILDASAHAPVTAFTDHAFAGHLGAEVYGKAHVRNSKSSTQLLEPQHKKRTSSFGNILLRGRRASSSDLLETEKRRSTMSGLVESKIRTPLDDDDDDNVKDTTPLQQSESGGLHSRVASLHTGGTAIMDDDEESDEGQRDDEIYHGPPTTLLAELQLRKQQQKHRTRPLVRAFPNGMHSTLLEMDAVAQVEQKSRKKKRTVLAWEDPNMVAQDDEMEEDEDVPLGMLYAKKQIRDPTRPMGLMERRDMEDNEPLSQRRNRLQGKPINPPRASTMMHISAPQLPGEDEGETLAERTRRIKEAGGTVTGLPSARPVSGDFATEMMSQFGGDLLNTKDVKGKGKEVSTSPSPEEEETLGQRRKRLQAEREARAKEVGNVDEAQRPAIATRRSMADLLSAHPSAGADRVVSYQKPVGGLLGLHEQKSAHRANTLLNIDTTSIPAPQRQTSGGFKSGLYNDAKGGIVPPAPVQNSFNAYNNPPQFAQPTMAFNQNFNNGMMMPFANPYAMNGMQMGYNPNMQMYPGMNGMNMSGMVPNPMAGMSMLQMGQGVQPLNQGQIDMVERWRQSVMQ